MAIFGPGVGGGLLAAAGAVKGLGEGITAAGELQGKKDLETHMNELAMQRETAIERLRQGHEETMQKQQQTFAQEQQARGIAGGAAAQTRTQKFEHGEHAAHEAAATGRTHELAQAREYSALVGAESRVGGKQQNGMKWEVHNIQTPGMNPDGTPNPLLNKTVQTLKLPEGVYTQGNRGFVRVDDSGKPLRSAESFARLKQEQTGPAQQALLADPLGTVPSGPRAGMTKAAAFEDQFGYIPQSWLGAATAAQQKQQSSASTRLSLPSGLVTGIGGPHATSVQVAGTPASGGNEGEGTEVTNEESADQASGEEGPAPSQGSNSYGAVANQ
jgi:hypothetical protein